MLSTVSKAGYDYFEIGFRADEKIIRGKGKWYYSNEEDITHIKNLYQSGCKIAVLLRCQDINIDNFVNKIDSTIDLIRVLMDKSTSLDNGNKCYNEQNIITSVNCISNLIAKGYTVCFNIGCADIISDNEIDLICKHISNVNIKSLYLADTYGSFTEKNIPIVINKFHKKLNEYNSSNNIIFGFHIHNNNENALSKYNCAKYNGVGMIDSCIGGLGRGAGNLQTEFVILDKINQIYNKDILWNIINCSLILCKYNENYDINTYFLKIMYAVAGILSLHPDYIRDISKNTKLQYIDKYYLIFNIYEYTQTNKLYNYIPNLISTLLAKIIN